MNQLYKSQFIHRLRGADFHPRRRTWLAPVTAALLIFMVWFVW